MKNLRIRTEQGDLMKSTKDNSRSVAWSQAFPPSRYHTAKWLKSKPEEDLTLVGHPIILKETPESPEEDLTLVGHPIILKETPKSPEEDLALISHPILLKETPESPEEDLAFISHPIILKETPESPEEDLTLISNAVSILHGNSLLAPVLFNEPVAE
jgi:hypothetical protein